MTKITANAGLSKVLETPLPVALPRLPEAMEDLRVSVERFCLLAGVEALGEMLSEDAEALCGPRHGRSPQRRGHRWGHRWGTTTSEIAYHGGKVKITRPRVRDLGGPGATLGELAGTLGPRTPAGLGDEPDGAEGLDAQVPPCRTALGGRPAGPRARRHLEVGGLAALRRHLAQEARGVAVL